MIKEILRDDTNFDGVDSSGKKSATRYLAYSCDKGDSTMLLAESNLIPKIGDVHPNYTRWTVESISKPKYSEGKPEFHFEIKYSYGGSSAGGGGGSGKKDVDGEEITNETPPWKLGPQNVKFSTIEIEEPLYSIYDVETGRAIPFCNTAGNRLLQTAKAYILEISFSMNYQHVPGKWKKTLYRHSINDYAEKVCNIVIDPYCGKIKPFYPTLHTVYENDGKTVKWEYETIEYVIDVYNYSMQDWRISALNVGRLARFQDEDGKLSKPEPIFCYTPWTSENEFENAKIPMKYGSIRDVQKAQAAYEKVVKGKKIPWSQIDEDMPLAKDGTLLQSALEYNSEGMNKYLKIEGFDVQPESWMKYDLPREI